MYSVTIFILFSIYSSFANDLPSYMPRCYVDDPDVNECVLRAFNEIRPHVSNGIEEIGLPPLNPLIIPKMTMRQNTPMANYTVIAYNFTIAGLDNYDIKEFRFDPETMSFRFRIEFGTILMSSSGELNGHIMNIPVEGEGSGKCAIGPISAIMEVKGNIRKSKGIDYYNSKDGNVHLDIGDSSYYIEGLFNNNQRLNRMTNEMFNANSVMVTKALTPMFEKLAETGVMRFMKTLTKIPFYKLFPPSH